MAGPVLGAIAGVVQLGLDRGPDLWGLLLECWSTGDVSDEGGTQNLLIPVPVAGLYTGSYSEVSF